MVSVSFNNKIHEEGKTILRVSKEVRGFLAEAPLDDLQVRSLLHDCDVLDRVGQWLSGVDAISFPNGVLTTEEGSYA